MTHITQCATNVICVFNELCEILKMFVWNQLEASSLIGLICHEWPKYESNISTSWKTNASS
jgi:hypothetical protein